MSLQGSFKCSGWLNRSNFMKQRISDKKSSPGKWAMSKCLVFMCGMRRILKFLSQMRSGAVLMESRHEEGRTDKQGLYQRKRSDRVLTTYIRYVLGWPASEEFWEGVKHDLVYELLGRVLQLSFGPFLVFREDVQSSLRGAIYNNQAYRGQRRTQVFL